MNEWMRIRSSRLNWKRFVTHTSNVHQEYSGYMLCVICEIQFKTNNVCVCVFIQDRKGHGPSQSLSYCSQRRLHWYCGWQSADQHLQDAHFQIPLWHSELQPHLQIRFTHWLARLFEFTHAIRSFFVNLQETHTFICYLPPQMTKYIFYSFWTLNVPQWWVIIWFRPSTSGSSLTWQWTTELSTSLTTHKLRLFTL